MILTADIEVITDHINNESQGWTRKVTVRMLEHKVRATIYRDSYDFQSRIKVEVWPPATLEWNLVHTLSGVDHPDLPSSSLLQYGKTDKTPIFEGTAELVDELLAYAQEILS